MDLLGLFVRHRTAANLLMALMLIAGLVAAFKIRAQYFPDVVINEVSVIVAWSGAGAEDVDDRAARRLDDRGEVFLRHEPAAGAG